MALRLILLTSLTMIAFAANSIFCRLALIDPTNDPLSFTLVRLTSGALALTYFFVSRRKADPLKADVKTFSAPLMLFAYALFFSLSYVNMDAGTGALILFASVQLTMIVWAYVNGQRLNVMETAGIAIAVAGFVYLLLPGADMPPIASSILMALSGISWGIYSLLGQGNHDPIFSTSRNFVLALPLAAILFVSFPFELTSQGCLWAVLSGALTSGLGYVIWYAVLRDLVTTTAAIVQLSVPAIAAFGGVLFLGESVHIRLIISSLLILSGIFLKVRASRRS